MDSRPCQNTDFNMINIIIWLMFILFHIYKIHEIKKKLWRFFAWVWHVKPLPSSWMPLREFDRPKCRAWTEVSGVQVVQFDSVTWFTWLSLAACTQFIQMFEKAQFCIITAKLCQSSNLLEKEKVSLPNIESWPSDVWQKLETHQSLPAACRRTLEFEFPAEKEQHASYSPDMLEIQKSRNV